MNELVSKVEKWIEQGIISVRTGKKILAVEGIEAETALHIRSSGRLISIISILGACLVGLGVLLFIGNNWAGMSVTEKLAIIFSAIVVAYGTGYWLQYIRGDYPRVGEALIMLGGIIYGAGLFLVAQFFHTNANPTLLFLIWALGIAPLVIFLRSAPLFGLSVVIVTFWTEFAVAYDGIFGSLFGGTIPTPHYWYLIALAILVGVAYKFRFGKAFGLLIASFYIWFGTTVVVWQVESISTSSFAVTMLYFFFLGLLIMLAGRLFGRFEQLDLFGFPMRVLGIVAVVVPLYVLSFNEALYQYSESVVLPTLALGTLYGLMGAVFVLLAVYMMREKSEDHRWFAWREGGIIALIAILGILFYVFPIQYGIQDNYYYDYSSRSFHPFVLPWNVALLAFNVLLIMIGYFERRNIFVNFGLFFFLVHVISRYFDVFALKLGTSFSFITGGILLIVLAVALTRFRARLVEKMKETPELSPTPKAIS